MAKTLKKHWGTNRYIAIKKNNWERHIFVKMANEHLKEVEGTTLVVCGDTPLITTHTLQKLIEHHESTHAQATVLSTTAQIPFGYGRIVRDEQRDYNVLSKKKTRQKHKSIN